jgi:hypothetical protein
MINISLTVREALWILSKIESYDTIYDKITLAFESAGSVANCQANLDGWVPVTERLPELRHNAGQSSDDVFVALQYLDGGHLMSIGYYSHYDKAWRIRAAKHGWQPTHWMPLPAPPTDGK